MDIQFVRAAAPAVTADVPDNKTDLARAVEEYKFAVALYNRGAYADAKTRFTAFFKLATNLTLEPRTVASAQFFLGRCHMQLGEYDAAERLLTAFTANAIFTKSKDAQVAGYLREAQFRLGETAIRRGRWTEAETRLAALVGKEEHTKESYGPWIQAYLGTAYLEQRKFAEAEKSLGSVTNSAPLPLYQYARIELARAYEQQGKNREAISTLVAVVGGTAGPLTNQARLNLAALYNRTDQLDAAARVLGALEVATRNTDLHTRVKAELRTCSMKRGVATFQAGDYERAVKLFESVATEKSAEQPQALAHLSVSLANLSAGEADTDKAQAFLRRADAALATLVKEYSTSPLVHSARISLAAIAFRKEDFERAAGLYSQVVAAGSDTPGYANAVFGLAWSEYRRGRNDVALRHFTAARTALGDTAAGREAGQMEVLLKTLRDSAQGTALEKEKKPGEALALYRQILRSADKAALSGTNAGIRTAYHSALLSVLERALALEERPASAASCIAEFKKLAPAVAAGSTVYAAGVVHYNAWADGASQDDAAARKQALVRRSVAIALFSAAASETLPAAQEESARYALCVLHADAADWKSARTQASEFERRFPRSANILRVRLVGAEADVELGKEKDAIELLDKMRKDLEVREPTALQRQYRSRATELLARAHLRAAEKGREGRPNAMQLADALTHARSAHELAPLTETGGRALLAQGRILAQQGKTKDALAILDRARSVYKEFTDIARDANSEYERLSPKE